MCVLRSYQYFKNFYLYVSHEKVFENSRNNFTATALLSRLYYPIGVNSSFFSSINILPPLAHWVEKVLESSRTLFASYLMHVLPLTHSSREPSRSFWKLREASRTPHNCFVSVVPKPAACSSFQSLNNKSHLGPGRRYISSARILTAPYFSNPTSARKINYFEKNSSVGNVLAEIRSICSNQVEQAGVYCPRQGSIISV